MARNEDGMKEGVDFKWVTNKGTNAKTRKFFTKAEKEAMAAKKEAPKKAEKRAAPKPKAESTGPKERKAVMGTAAYTKQTAGAGAPTRKRVTGTKPVELAKPADMKSPTPVTSSMPASTRMKKAGKAAMQDRGAMFNSDGSIRRGTIASARPEPLPAASVRAKTALEKSKNKRKDLITRGARFTPTGSIDRGKK